MDRQGEKLRKLRLERGVTQRELVRGLVTPSMLSQIETGRLRASDHLMQSLARRLDVDMECLVDTADGSPRQRQVKLQIAHYFLLSQQPAAALEVLSGLQRLVQAESIQNRRTLLEIRARRQLLSGVKPLSATHYNHGTEVLEAWDFDNPAWSTPPRELIFALEALREYALRQKDASLLFSVCAESGHVEYATGNLQGAMTEWENALQIVQLFLPHTQENLAAIELEMTEIHGWLYKIYDTLGERSLAQDHLNQVWMRTAAASSLQAVSNKWVQQALISLHHNEVSRAQALVDQATDLWRQVHQVQRHVWSQTGDRKPTATMEQIPTERPTDADPVPNVVAASAEHEASNSVHVADEHNFSGMAGVVQPNASFSQGPDPWASERPVSPTSIDLFILNSPPANLSIVQSTQQPPLSRELADQYDQLRRQMRILDARAAYERGDVEPALSLLAEVLQEADEKGDGQALAEATQWLQAWQGVGDVL